MTSRTIHGVLWVVFLLTFVLVAYLELKPGGEQIPFIWWDKAQHFLAYGTLAFLAGLAARSVRQAALLAVLLALAGYGLEIAQYYVGRDYDLMDEVANALGCLAGFLGSLAFKALYRWVLGR